MVQWQDEYFRRPNGDVPVRNWLQGLSAKERAGVTSKMQSLREKGLELKKTRMLKPVSRISKKDKQDRHLYELIHRNLRVCTHFDVKRRIFVYLGAWQKQKNIQPRDIADCRARLHEYLVQQGERQ